MPPWPASTKVGGPFRDERTLTDAEIATIAAWSAAGCPEGDPKDAPEPRVFSSDWKLGDPDLVLTMPEPYELAASGDDAFRVFVLKTNFKEDRWIRAVDFKPGNRKVVHHIIAGSTPRAKRGSSTASRRSRATRRSAGSVRAFPCVGSCRSGPPAACRATPPRARATCSRPGPTC